MTDQEIFKIATENRPLDTIVLYGQSPIDCLVAAVMDQTTGETWVLPKPLITAAGDSYFVTICARTKQVLRVIHRQNS